MGHKPKFLSIAIAPILFSSEGDFLVVAEILQTLYFQVYTFSKWHKLSSVMAQKVTKSSIIHQLKLKQKKSFEIAKKNRTDPTCVLEIISQILCYIFNSLLFCFSQTIISDECT